MKKIKRNPKPILFLDLDKLDILENFLEIANKMNYTRYIENNIAQEAINLTNSLWTLPRGKNIILKFIEDMTKFKIALYIKQTDEILEELDEKYTKSYKMIKLLFK
jgi:hypothetical protein